MGKKKKKVEIESEAEAEAESKSNIHESTQIESQTNLSLLNGDSHKKKKKKKIKAEKELNSEAKADEIPTVSIAIAGSIIDNAQSLELATRLAGQIARAATIFRIDEGMLPPLDAPHHLRKHEWAPYREGVTLKERATSSVGTLVDVGLDKNVVVDHVLEPGIRITVAMGTNHNLDSELPCQVVSFSKPREEAGTYWGYKVRYASNISSVFTDCPYKGGYDHLIGTSEHGLIVSSSQLKLPAFRHLLIAFGGLSGLEKSVEEDLKLKGKNVRDIFNLYLNTCPHQGSRTIRTEEALLISLQYFQEPITRALQGAVSC
ncbi:putative methyltransferase C9orf114 homolog isoform X4 [Durio zibethinus]|uniref:Methyltransferase C9orf114 homolog isoform X4 n=1 Tax=Durio zibethinus TaxID=66656 RepID=A0A6P6AAX1_DURZI|nr:putative methyltransferase C9orf114 homolog isoform X4 [Durio zibethinus]